MIGAAVVLSGCSFAGPVTLAGATVPASVSAATALAQVNATRAHFGAAALGYNTTLEAIARKQARLMAAEAVMSHELAGNLHDRTIAGGYDGATGENLAEGQKTLELAITAWLNSPPHRSTLLNTRFTEFGLAVATSSTGRAYWAFIAGGSFAAWR